MRECVPAELHVNGTATGHHRGILHGSPHNHDGIMQAALCLIDELLRAASQHHGGCAGSRAPLEQVVPLRTNLPMRMLAVSRDGAGWLNEAACPECGTWS